MAEDVFGIVGTVIAGAYQVESVVAEGAFGVVCRAHHAGWRAPVALKLLKVPQPDAAQRAEVLALFRAEAEVLFRLSASLPSVVRPLHVDAFTTSDGRFVPYIVMEWLDGLTLDALIRQRIAEGLAGVPLRKLVRLLTPVARALERAHHFTGPEGAVSVVHGDLKPENIFIAQVAGEEVVKLLNFGIGKVRSAASQVPGQMSQDSAAPTAFTPAYAAPEQWAPRDYGQTGPRTDVWGLALCIVEALAARPMMEGDPRVMRGIALDAARRPTPRHEGVEVSDAVEAVFARALSLDPRSRQPDAGVFWNELTAALQVPEAERGGSVSRDARSEDSRAPCIELVELRSRPPVASVPRMPAANPAIEHALAADLDLDLDLDLEFDLMNAPRSSSGKQRIAMESRVTAAAPVPARAVGSGQHFVPDLELAPPSAARRPSGARPIERAILAPPTLLDLDESPADAVSSLDLDLPTDEPLSIRSLSSPRVAAAQGPNMAPPRSPPGSITVARESRPPLSAVLTPPPSAGLDVGPTSALRAPRASVPPGAPPATALLATHLSSLDLSKYEERPLSRRLRPAFALLGGAVLVALVDPVYAAATGEALVVVGLHLSVFAEALFVLAVGLGAREGLRAPGS
ncbi:MAG: serine/threonine-protein kinase [Polyangiaceae bacterium]